MGRHREGSDIDLCLEVRELSHQSRLGLMAAIDELLQPLLRGLGHRSPGVRITHLDRRQPPVGDGVDLVERYGGWIGSNSIRKLHCPRCPHLPGCPRC